MSHTSTTISAPVSTSDVAAVLAVASNNVGYLCSNLHGKINKWAKYKPERSSTLSALSIEARKGNSFGLSAQKEYTSRNSFINAAKDGSLVVDWKYTPPAGGSASPYRLGDFNGYDHQAEPPFGSLLPITCLLPSENYSSLVIPLDEPGDDDRRITIADMIGGNNDFANWYLGVLLVNSAGKWLMASTSGKIGTAGDWQVDFGHVATSYAGEYTAIPFLASKPFPTSGEEPSDVRIVGIGQKGVKVTLKTMSQQYEAFANCMYPDWVTNKIDYTVQIKNDTSTARTFSNVVLVIAEDDSGKNSTSFVSFGNVTVQPGETWIKSGSKAASSRAYRYCRIQYTGSTEPWIDFEDPDAEDLDAPGR